MDGFLRHARAMMHRRDVCPAQRQRSPRRPLSHAPPLSGLRPTRSTRFSPSAAPMPQRPVDASCVWQQERPAPHEDLVPHEGLTTSNSPDRASPLGNLHPSATTTIPFCFPTSKPARLGAPRPKPTRPIACHSKPANTSPGAPPL